MMSEAVNQAEPFLVPSSVRGRPRVVAVASGKGGVGKSISPSTSPSPCHSWAGACW